MAMCKRLSPLPPDYKNFLALTYRLKNSAQTIQKLTDDVRIQGFNLEHAYINDCSLVSQDQESHP